MTMPIPDGSAITTPNQMLDRIDASAKAIDGLTGEVRAMRSEISPALADMRHDLGDHETRLRVVESKLPDQLGTRLGALEQARWKATGGVALLSSLIASGVVAAVLEATRR